MKQGWEVQKLGDLCEVITKGTTPTSLGFKFIENGINFIKVESISSNGYFIKNKLASIDEDCHEALKRSQLKEGDILFSIAGALGRTALVTNEVLPANTNQALAIVRLRPNAIILKEYILSALRSGFTLEQVEKLKGGVAQQNLSLGQMKSFQIPIPSLEEQKQIVAVLDKAFAAIDLAKANIEKNLQNAKELFQSKLNEIFTQKGEGWEEKKLGDSSLLSIIDGDRGKNYPKKSDFFPEGHCVFMNTGNVRPNGFDFTTVMFITEERDKLLRKGKLQRNDVVMTTRGTIGNLGWFNDAVKYENIRINSGMLIFRVNQQKILPEYLFTVLRSPVVTKQIKERTSGAAQPQLPIKTLVHFDIPFHPDLDKQRMMVGKIQELESMTDDLIQIGIKKLRSLDELKKSTLQKAFAGELIK